MKEKRKVIAVIAAVGALALIAAAIVSCVPPVGVTDLEDAGGSPGITGPGIAVVISPSSGGGPGGSGYSLIPSQIEASTTYYELAVRKINAGGTWEYRRTAARRGGTLAVAVDPGYQYELLVLGGFLPGEGRSPILLQSAFATTPAIGNTVHTENISLTKVDIDASRYEVLLNTAAAGPPQPSDTKKPFRAGGGTGVMELDLPKWVTPGGSSGIFRWLPDWIGSGQKATVKVMIRGVAPLIQAYNAAHGYMDDKRLFGRPAHDTTGTGFFDGSPSFLPHLSLTALMEGEIADLYPLHTPWSFDLPEGQYLNSSGIDGEFSIQWDQIEARSDDVWTPNDTDAKLYWDAYYYAFSNGDPALRFDRWKIQNGLEHSIDTLDGGGNTGGAVYVKIGAGGGAMLDQGGHLVIGVRQPLPKIWTEASYYFDNQAINKIVYGGWTFVAVGERVKPLYSSDGRVAWTSPVTPPLDDNVITVAYGNGTFVAGGYNGIIGYSSDDARTWTGLDGDDTYIGPNDVYAVAYGNGRWVAGGATGKVSYSADGSSWTQAYTGTAFDDTEGARITALLYADGKWVGGGDTGKLAYSTDNGATWEPASTLPSGWGVANVNAIVYGGATGLKKFVAVGQNGKIALSTHGESWTSANDVAGYTGHFNSVIFAKSKFVAAGSEGILMSYDGDNWRPAGPAYNISAIAYGADCFVAGTNDGRILYSPGDTNFTVIEPGTPGNPLDATDTINTIIYADGKWVIGTSNSKILWCIPN